MDVWKHFQQLQSLQQIVLSALDVKNKVQLSYRTNNTPTGINIYIICSESFTLQWKGRA